MSTPRCRHPHFVATPTVDTCPHCGATRAAKPGATWRAKGRPPEARSECVVIRLSPAESEALDKLLARTGETRGGFVARIVAAESERPL